VAARPYSERFREKPQAPPDSTTLESALGYFGARAKTPKQHALVKGLAQAFGGTAGRQVFRACMTPGRAAALRNAPSQNPGAKG
jgi:hypothetical protein